MRAPRAAARRVVTDFPSPRIDGDNDPQATAMMEVAAAMNRLADAVEAGTSAITPAAETVHSMGARLDALCSWLSGKWPWVIITSGAIIWRTVEAAPDQAPKLLAAVIQALTGTGT